MSSDVVNTIAPSWISPQTEATFNKLGTIPIVQSIIGPMRATVALVVLVCSTALWTVSCDTDKQKRYVELLCWSGSQFSIGVIETLPIIGTLFHIWLHAVPQTSSITWDGDLESSDRHVICVVKFDTSIPAQWK